MMSKSSIARVIAVLAVLGAIGISSSVRSQSATPGCVNDRYGSVQCPPPGGTCIKDLAGEVRCSRADGGILLDRYKVPVCGPGQCITDIKGEVFCSRVPKGSAALDRYGEAVCTEGCVNAAAQACTAPSR
jgi:hypothetical protein